MSSDESVEIIGVGDQLREEIQSGEFNRFVIFTYGITPEYLEWFTESDQVAVCGPNETVEAVRESKPSPLVTAFNRKTHAKIYLLYNEERVVAYLGSFNFTRNGLYGSVEWGVRYEGDLVESPPDPRALVEGDARTEISTSPLIEQILTVVAASLSGEDTDTADSWVANTGLGEGVVHTLRSNTLQTALAAILEGVENTVEIQYYSPFVTYRGVTEFVKYLPDEIDESALELTVLSKRLDRVQDDEELLAPEEVEKLNERFRAFRFRARAPGDQGDELPDGRELRSGMAHLKAISISERKPSSTDARGVILTSANLSKRAWSRTSDGFEIGVALAGTDDCRRLHRFFTQLLPQCYVKPSDTVLSTTGSSQTSRSRGTDEWLDERLRNRMALGDDTVSISWDDSLPELDSLEGTVSVRNISTGSRTNHLVSFESTEDGYAGTFPAVSSEPNQIIDFVRVVATSRHAPPELVYSAREVRELRADLGLDEDSDPLPDDWSEFDEIIWNNEIRRPVEDAGFGDVNSIKSARLVSNYDAPEPHYAIYEPEQQPHVDHVITETDVDERELAPFGTLGCLRIETHPLIDIDPTDFQFYTSRRHQVEPLGFSYEENTLRYYFSPDTIDGSLRVRLQSLASRYIQGTSTELEVEEISSDLSVELSDHILMESWSATPATIDPVLSQPRTRVPDLLQTEDQTGIDQTNISEETEAEVTPPEDVLTAFSADRLSVWWRPSRTFRSGTIQPVSETIPKQAPRTRVTYRGIVTFRESGEEVYFGLPRADFLVKEQPFVEKLNVSFQAVPTEQKLEGLREDSLLGWIVLRQSELLDSRARDVTHCINPQLYLNGEMVPRQIFGATTSGGILCFPIMGKHVGMTLDASLRLWISGGPAKTAHYAEAVRDLNIKIDQDEGGLQIKAGEQTHHITDSERDMDPLLEPFADIIQKEEFEKQTRAQHPDDKFRIQSYSPLNIIPDEMLLLHFTDR
jgi:hypothetical protein